MADPDDVLPVRALLPGERSRTPVGVATAVGRPAQFCEADVDRNGCVERLYQYVDRETGVVLKLVSLDCDWSMEYERSRHSPQPGYYYEEPLGYMKRASAGGPRRGG